MLDNFSIKLRLILIMAICSIAINIPNVYSIDDHDYADPDVPDEYAFIENIHAPGYEHVDEMTDPVTIRRSGDGSLQSITFQVSSTGGHSARTYRTESFYVVNN